MALLIMTVCTVQFQKLYPVFRKQEPMMQEIVNLSLKMFKVRPLRSLKCLKTILNSLGQPVQLTQQHHTHNILMLTL